MHVCKGNSPSISSDAAVSTPYALTNRLMCLRKVQVTLVWTLHFCQLGGGVRNPDLTSCGDFTSRALCVRMWQGSWDSSTSGSCFDLPHPFPPPGRSMYVPGTHQRNSPKITPQAWTSSPCRYVPHTCSVKLWHRIWSATLWFPPSGLRRVPFWCGFCQRLLRVPHPSEDRRWWSLAEFLLVKENKCII